MEHLYLSDVWRDMELRTYTNKLIKLIMNFLHRFYIAIDNSYMINK